MHWVIQNNIKREEGYDAFIEALGRMGVSYDLVKVVPFSHDLIPDVNPKNPVIACGAYTMEQISKAKGWNPGIFTNDNFTYEVWSKEYEGYVLNDDAKVTSFDDAYHVQGISIDEEVFIRPCKDGKEFAGLITRMDDFLKWRMRVLNLEEEGYTTVTKDTMIMIAPLKKIEREYRFFVVDGKVITGSQYKIGSRVTTAECTEDSVIKFAQKMVDIWQPDIAFVIDIAMTPDGFKVIEINCLNGAGFYACNMPKVADAVERLTPLYETD